MITLTPESTALFVELVIDAGNWNGSPLFGGNVGRKPAAKGHLTALKKQGLVTTEFDENRVCCWVRFTESGVDYARSIGLNVEAIV
jgi:hypothetical protein